MREYKSTLRPLDFSELMAEEAKNQKMIKMAGMAVGAGMDTGVPEGGVDNLDANIDGLTSDANIAAVPTEYDAFLDPEYSFGDGSQLSAGPSDGFITPDASVGNYDFAPDARGFDVAPISVGSSIDALSSDANIEAAAQNIFEYNPEEEESMGFLDLMKKGKGIFNL